MSMSLLDVVLTLAALPALCASGYLLWLTVQSRRSAPPAYGPAQYRFEIIIPAHNEEAGIARTVQSVRSLNYPGNLFGVTVVADNCTDRTASFAQAAGAQVLVRQDDARRGKGYALAHGFAHVLDEGQANGVVVIDADTVVSANLLHAFSARFGRGAQAVQADYAVQNPSDSWRTRLMAVAFGSFHALRSLARERLKVSCGLRGNGMCFSAQLLRQVPHDAVSLVEDVEYGIRLGEAGHRVHYAAEAHVFGAMVTSESASRSQRRRWESGRWQLAKRHGFQLLSGALAKRDRVLFDLAVDLLIPPLSFVALLDVAGFVASAAVAIARRQIGLALIAWGVCGVCAAAYVLRGWALSGTGARGLIDLLASPLYVVWKALLVLRGSGARRDEWIRTARPGEGRGRRSEGGGAQGPRPLPDSFRDLWAATLKHEWSALVVVPAHAEDSAVNVARALAKIGEVDFIDGEEVTPSSSTRVTQDMLAQATRGRVVVALDPVVSNPAVLPIVLAADAALICITLGQTEIASARRTVELIGRERFIGCVTVAGA